MNKGKLFSIITIVNLLIIALFIGGFTYYQNSANYIETDNAKVNADIVPITVVSSGKITDWTAAVGTPVTEGQELGVLTGQTTTSITSPIDGTIVQSKALKGQTVAAGQTIAQVADLKNLYIIANIEETDIKDVSNDQEVDIVVDVDKDKTIKGKVVEIGRATSSEFSLFPSQNASGDYTKEVEYVPVKISMENSPVDVVPGMNATVRIHR